MKAFTFCGLLLICFSLSCSASHENLPHLAIANDVIDLGDVEFEKEQSVEGVLTIENRGSAPLKIFKKQVSCGCTISEWPADEVLLRATMKVRLRVRPKNSGGDQSSILTFFSNDPVTPKSEIRILWHELASIAFSPETIQLTSLANFQDYTSEIKATFAKPTFLRDLNLVPLSTFLSAGWKPLPADLSKEEPITEAVLVVILSRRRPPGNGASQIRIEDRNGSFSTNFSVAWKSSSLFEASPSAIYHSNVVVGRPVPTSILIRSQSKQPFELVTLKVNDKEISFSVEKPVVDDDSIRKITFDVATARERSGVDEQVLNVFINIKSDGPLEVPVRLFVK